MHWYGLQAVYLNSLGFYETDICLFLGTLLIYSIQWVLETLIAVTYHFCWVLRKHYKVGSWLSRLLWFTRAHKVPEPGRWAWQGDSAGLMEMYFSSLKRTQQSPQIEIWENNIKLEIVNILKIKQHCLRNARSRGKNMWFELLAMQLVMRTPHILG